MMTISVLVTAVHDESEKLPLKVARPKIHLQRLVRRPKLQRKRKLPNKQRLDLDHG